MSFASIFSSMRNKLKFIVGIVVENFIDDNIEQCANHIFVKEVVFVHVTIFDSSDVTMYL